MALDAMKRADGIDPKQRALPPGYSHSSFNIAALTAIGPHIKLFSARACHLVVHRFRALVRDQGTDVSVPHLASGRALRCADSGFGILAGVLLKMGTYGFMRFSLPDLSRRRKRSDRAPGDGSAFDHRNHLRRVGCDGAKRCQETGCLLVGLAPGLCDARDCSRLIRTASTAR